MSKQTKTLNTEQWLEKDRQFVWHPYTNTDPKNPLYMVESAEGVNIKLTSGETLVDGMSSWWAVLHGYNHPTLNKALHQQIDKVSHVMFGGFTHQPAIELAEKLIQLTSTDNKADFERVFFSDSGSVSVEVAIKMAIQYWFAQGKTQKNKLLTLRNGYHGDTFAAMSVTDPENSMHSMFKGILAEHLFAEIPVYGEDIEWKEEYIVPLKQQIEQHKSSIAAVILEPLVQNAGGMKFYSSHYLKELRKLCDQHDILLIFDEIATGFGRTGDLFAYQAAEVIPDILCLGKALTGGYLTLAATLASSKVVAGIHSESQGNKSAGLLMHGPTFMANPLACSVALANLKLLEEYDWQNKVKAIEEQLSEELLICESSELVADVRVKGAIGVVEMKEPVDNHWLVPRLVELGVWLRPFGKLIYLMPPFIIQPEQLSKLTKAVKTVITEMQQL